MTYTRLIGLVCGKIIDLIVRWLALSRIHPNVLTFLGLMINTWAENTIPKCKVGFLERPERVVLLILGALFDRMAPVLWVLAVLSNVTVIHRMIYTWQETKQLEDAQRGTRLKFSEQTKI